MINSHSKWIGAALAVAMVTTLATAAEPTLKIGSPAPKLQTGKWVQGEPVKDFKEGKAYIVEFWATWCPPCKVSIPHLNEIHNKYKEQGLVVIGQDCSEKNEDLVAPFVEKMGDKMTYRVALDDKSGGGNGKMAESWMTAAGLGGIPSAFLVDTKGVIAWIGHPMELKEKVIEAVLAGTFDVKKAADEFTVKQKHAKQMRGIWTELNMAMQKKDWDTVNAKVAEAEKLMPEDERDNLDMVRMDVAFGKKDYPTAYKLAAQIGEAQKANALFQNQLAWRILTDESIEKRDLKLAETLARRANEATKGNDAGILDTLARALFMQGKKEEAIEIQSKAVKLGEDGQLKVLQSTLDAYKKGELPKAE